LKNRVASNITRHRRPSLTGADRGPTAHSLRRVHPLAINLCLTEILRTRTAMHERVKAQVRLRLLASTAAALGLLPRLAKQKENKHSTRLQANTDAGR
jgi:hypothetical protein